MRLGCDIVHWRCAPSRLLIYRRLVVVCGLIGICSVSRICLTAPAPLLVTGPSGFEDTVTDIDDLQRSCGRRSLFLWLRLQGHKVSYEDVERVVPMFAQGTSMQALVESSGHWSAPLKAIKIGPAELAQVPLPAIVHVWLDGRQRIRGHYAVLLKVLPNTIVYGDGSSGVIGEITRERFQEVWSGYLLIADEGIDKWMRTIAIVQLLALIAICGYRLMTNNSRIEKLGAVPVVLLFCLGILGCQRQASDPVKAPISAALGITEHTSIDDPSTLPLRTSIRTKNLGTVKFGDQARAVFTLSNAIDRSLALKLGRPSCNCLKATLGNEVIEPRETTELELLLGGAGVSGPREGSVTVSIGEHESVLVFTARGTLEGMTSLPYVMKLPRDMTGFKPPPIVGEIVLGLERINSDVKLVNTIVLEDSDRCIELGEPTLFAVDNMGAYIRRRFQVPVGLRNDLRPEAKTYQVRLTYCVDDRTGDYGLALNVFPRAENSASQTLQHVEPVSNK